MFPLSVWQSREGVWGNEGEDEFYYAQKALAAAQKSRKAAGPLALTLRSASSASGAKGKGPASARTGQAANKGNSTSATASVARR